ncbi:MAG: hypothetical protein IIC67_00255 [Thaumarchaeota archaeon]|nr:hypothetical protein [Nitrososphaerota archaeon]
MITDDIISAMNLPTNNIKVKLEIEIEFDQDAIRAIDSNYDFWQLVLDMEPFKAEVISVELLKHE